MAAAALALEGWDVRFLGADTPAEVISSMAQALGAQAIALGSSPAADADGLAAQIRALREGVGENMAIWLGGHPFPPRPWVRSRT